jgi:small subunit ribosomal protein S10
VKLEDIAMAQRIRTKLKSFEHHLVDQSAVEITDMAKRSKARVVGPAPLLTWKERFMVNRSSHIDKKSMDQF